MRLRELVLGVELRALRVEHLQEVRQPRLEPLLRELGRTRARAHRFVQQRQPRVRPVVRHERCLRLLHRPQHGRAVLRARLVLVGVRDVDARLHATEIEQRPREHRPRHDARRSLAAQRIERRRRIARARGEREPRQVVRLRGAHELRLRRQLPLGAQHVGTTLDQLRR